MNSRTHFQFPVHQKNYNGLLKIMWKQALFHNRKWWSHPFSALLLILLLRDFISICLCSFSLSFTNLFEFCTFICKIFTNVFERDALWGRWQSIEDASPCKGWPWQTVPGQQPAASVLSASVLSGCLVLWVGKKKENLIGKRFIETNQKQLLSSIEVKC